LLVLVLELCSLVLPLGELSLDDDELCSLVVVDGSVTTTGAGSATTIGAGAATTTGTGAATTIGAGATTTGAGYTLTGAGAEVVVSLVEVVLSVLSANPTAALPNSTATPKAKAAVFNECFINESPLVLQMTRSSQSKVASIRRTRMCVVPIAV
jgi:hypothetical protein